MSRLFDVFSFGDYWKQKSIEIKNEIDSCKDSYIIKVDEKEYYNYIVSKYTIKEITLRDNQDDMSLETKPTKKTRPDIYGRTSEEEATEIILTIPFEGDGQFFYCHGTSRITTPLIGHIDRNSLLRFHIVVGNYELQRLEEIKKNKISCLKDNLKWLNEDIKRFNKYLKVSAEKWIKERKAKTKYIQTIFGVKIEKYEEAPIPIPEKQREILKPLLLEKNEYALVPEEYENILRICFSLSLSMERSPATYSKLKEPEIRDHFLSTLQTHFKGFATGETFNGAGKTDILIRYEEKNIFIVECKFWAGEIKLLKSFDQLMKYITWRDTKTAIFIFNKKTNFTTVLKKIEPTVKNHPKFKSNYEFKDEKLRNEKSIFGYIFRHPIDDEHHFFLTIMAFNIPELALNSSK